MTWSLAHQIKLTSGRRSGGYTNIPLSAVGSGGRGHSRGRVFRPSGSSVRPPGSART